MTPGDAQVPRESLASAFAPKRAAPPDPQRRTLAGMVAPVTHLPSPVPEAEPETALKPAPAPEPPLAGPSIPASPTPRRRANQATEATAEGPRLRKAGVWVPASMIGKLQERRTGTRDTITDVVLAAVRVHRAAITTEALATQTAAAGAGEADPFENQTPRRRRDLGEPTTQITLLLTPRNLETLDAMADSARLSRSAFVSEALRRAL